jgi:RHS repeat-associated protein
VYRVTKFCSFGAQPGTVNLNRGKEDGECRYYDPEIGRFISPDTIVPDPYNPQCLNRYSYCLNNPLKYTDPSGHDYYSDMSNIYNDPGFNKTWYETIVSNNLPVTPSQPATVSNNLPNNTSQPLEPKEPEPSKPPLDNSVWAVAGPICLGLAADDATGIGVVDDWVIPIVGGVAGAIWVWDNWGDEISDALDVGVDAVGDAIDSGILWFAEQLKGGHDSNISPHTKDKHEGGDARRLRDQKRAEKGDANRPYIPPRRK